MNRIKERAQARRSGMNRARKDASGARSIKRFLLFLGIAVILMKLFIFEGPAASVPSSGADDGVFMPRTPTDYVQSVKNSMAICFSPDGKLMASGGLSNQIVITDMDGQAPARAVINAPDMSAVYAMSFSADKSVLAVAGDFNGSNIRTIDTTTGRETASFDEASVVSHIAFSPDSRYLLSVSSCTVRVWDIRNRRLVRVLHDNDMPTKAFFVSDGKYILTNHGLKLWDWISGEPEKNIINSSELFRGIGCDGRHCVFAGKEGLSIFDSATLSVKSLMAGDASGVSDITYNSRTGLVASVVNDRKLLLVDNAGKVRASLGIVGPARAISFSPDGNLLALGSGGDDIAIFRMKGRKQSGGDMVRSVSEMFTLAKDGLRLASWRMR